MKKLIVIAGLFIAGITVVNGQETKEKKNRLKISSYVDGYFAGYSNDLSQQDFQPYITVGARDNNFGVNVAQIGLSYENKRMRGNIVLHYGDIPQATWSDDYNMLQEANVGVMLTEGMWLDVGFFRPHLGTESFLPKDNMLSSTAYATYMGPFYQAGARLSYNKLQKWYFELWVLNGYNSFVDNNDAKSVGTLVTYNFSENTSITYDNLYGRESDDNISPDQNRFYQNIYLNHNWNGKVFLTIGFDHGVQSNSDLNDAKGSASMYTGLITTRYQFNPKWSVTGRAEIFKDKNGFISGTTLNTKGDVAGIELTGYTLGGEFRPVANSYIRAETRYTRAAKDLEVFVNDGKPTNDRFEVLFTMGLELDKVFNF